MKPLLVDGMSIVRQVYEACPGPDSPQRAADALKSTRGSLRRALTEHAPTHALAAFDCGGATWRHAIYPAYKSHRPPAPEPLRDALPAIRREIEALSIHTVALPDVEADDVLATVFHRWQREGRGPAVILSRDKDVATLAAAGAQVRDHFKKVWHDDAWCRNRFGVPVAQLAALLALTGDKTDGIPGVPRVGAVTAAKWLAQYGDIDTILAHAGEIPGKVGEALRENVAQLRMARDLLAFKTDVPCGLTWNTLRVMRLEEEAF